MGFVMSGYFDNCVGQ